MWCLPTVTDGLNVSWYMRCLSVVTDDRCLFAVSPLRGVPPAALRALCQLCAIADSHRTILLRGGRLLHPMRPGRRSTVRFLLIPDLLLRRYQCFTL